MNLQVSSSTEAETIQRGDEEGEEEEELPEPEEEDDPEDGNADSRILISCFRTLRQAMAGWKESNRKEKPENKPLFCIKKSPKFQILFLPWPKVSTIF